MAIDFHTHIFPKDVINEREEYFDDPGFRLLYSSLSADMADHTRLSDYIITEKLTGAVAMSFPWHSERHALRHNEYMTSISDRNHIFPFGTIPQSSPGKIFSAAEEIKKAGLHGIGEIAFYTAGLDRERKIYLRSILEAASALSLPVCLHLNEPVGHLYPGKYEPDLGEIYRIISDYPDARIILSHWGGGLIFYELMPEVREALQNVFYDTAATPFLYTDNIYSAALSITGPDKILFGSDFPLIGIERYRDAIDFEIMSDDDRWRIYEGNALDILNS